jgi:2-dehydro-3-deoxyphosphogluconate aldolase/(4S)-4-hydroxy-2-oxoglutarate aldolase
MSFLSLMDGVPVMPLVIIDAVADAVPMAEALVAGGLPVIEVALRTPQALAAVEAIATRVPQARVGVGSVIDPQQFARSRDAGARFAVSPGATPALESAAQASGLPWLPAAQTVSEVLALRERGHRMLKFFPAQSSGGVAFMRAIAGPVPDVQFCPTGGVAAETAGAYLALANVACVGGSWLTPSALVSARDWDAIRQLAASASGLRGR